MKYLVAVMVFAVLTIGFNDITVIDGNGSMISIKFEDQVYVNDSSRVELSESYLVTSEGVSVKLIEQMRIEESYLEDTTPARVIVMTDGEGDDKASMVRFLYYANDFDIEALIHTNSKYQRDGHSPATNDPWISDHVSNYEEILNNLRVHDASYPSGETLRNLIYQGDVDRTHLYDYPPFEDTEGSERIIEVLLDEDDRQVWVQAWGGNNTLAQALYKLKNSGKFSQEDYSQAVSKIRVFSINNQDYGLDYIKEEHPGVVVLESMAYKGSWDYSHPDGPFMNDVWVSNHLEGHGPLAEGYGKDSILEGDTPAFLNMIDNGLRADESPSYGGWGGRFSLVNGNFYTDSDDNSDIRWLLNRYIPFVQNDFQARLDWGVTKEFLGANHKPVIVLDVSTTFNAKAGDTITVSASDTYDPDGDDLTFKWWQYQETDTYSGNVTLTANGHTCQVFIPSNAKKGDNIHLMVEVTDDGDPELRSYKRVIVNITES